MKRILYKEASALSQLSVISFAWWLTKSRDELIQHCKIGGGLKYRQKQVASIYERFKLEIDSNLHHVPDEMVPAYYQEVYRILRPKHPQQEQIQIIQSTVLQELNKQLHSISDGKDYQTSAWNEILIRLADGLPPLDGASRKRLGALYNIATSAVDYWQLAISEINSQRAVMAPFPSPKTVHQSLPPSRPATGAKQSADEFAPDTWGKLLTEGLTVLKLKVLLSQIVPPLLDTEGKVTVDSNPGSWAAAIAALRDINKVSRSNNAALHRSIVSEFGKIASPNQLRTGYKADNPGMNKTYMVVQELAKAL